jgi:hypothetical protein
LSRSDRGLVSDQDRYVGAKDRTVKHALSVKRIALLT